MYILQLAASKDSLLLRRFLHTFLQHSILLGLKQAAIVWIFPSSGLLSHSCSVFIIYFCLRMVTHLDFTVLSWGGRYCVIYTIKDILSCDDSSSCHPNITQRMIEKTGST